MSGALLKCQKQCAKRVWFLLSSFKGNLLGDQDQLPSIYPFAFGITILLSFTHSDDIANSFSCRNSKWEIWKNVHAALLSQWKHTGTRGCSIHLTYFYFSVYNSSEIFFIMNKEEENYQHSYFCTNNYFNSMKPERIFFSLSTWSYHLFC